MKNSQFKKFISFFLYILAVILLSGCWDRIEVNDIALVMGTGIDYFNDDEIELSIEVKLPGGEASGTGDGGGGEQQTFVHSATGKTMAEALSHLQMRFPRRLFWGHNRVIVINEEYARKEGISQELEFFSRSPQARVRDRVFVTNVKAKKLLSTNQHLETMTAETLRELSDTNIGIDISVRDVLLGLKNDENEVVVPMITISQDTEGSVEGKNEVELLGTAAFRGNMMHDVLTMELTRGLLWFRNEIDLATVTIEPEEADGYISALMVSANSKLIPEIRDGEWRITIKAVSEDDIIQNTTNLDLTKMDVLQSVEKQFEEIILERLVKTVDRVQKEIKSDVLGFNEAFHRKYPNEWDMHKENWNDFFTNIEVDYDVKVYVRRLGLSTGKR
ncbi:Ger(x)C family spore germination protein [Evansella sp. AB-P1]|uniref:Ger(x)C family spore germination protein n=1 Tax=Evansella sp. AB-P1 TaxID=3037653 RepID=UPI00241CB012|nr:Ger(x)C family spore germination protein [Evansella sp. AB-P1]MDG5786807.1 Ger(x)C family spore germination protein [Evansella sp. AB-P1]